MGWVGEFAVWLMVFAAVWRRMGVPPTLLRDKPDEQALQIDADVGRMRSGCASGVPGAVEAVIVWFS